MENGIYEPADIVVCNRDSGLVLREKSLVAYQEETGRIMAVGNEAERIREQGMEGVKVISPFKNERSSHPGRGQEGPGQGGLHRAV